MPLSSPVDFSALVSESSCTEPLLNRVQWELFLPAHRHEFITRKLSEMARCRSEALPARHTSPDAATDGSERSPNISTPAPADPEVKSSMVDALGGFIMRACRDFCQLASGARTWITCCAVFCICTASFCRSKQTRRCAPPCGCLVLAVLVVMLHLLSTAGAAKVRPWRDATSNPWAEGKPNVLAYKMAAGPDGSLYVFGGIYIATGSKSHDLFKLDLDTKEWHLITPRGSVRPSARNGHTMATVGSDLFVFGGETEQGEEGRCACWPPSWGH